MASNGFHVNHLTKTVIELYQCVLSSGIGFRML